MGQVPRLRLVMVPRATVPLVVVLLVAVACTDDRPLVDHGGRMGRWRSATGKAIDHPKDAAAPPPLPEWAAPPPPTEEATGFIGRAADAPGVRPTAYGAAPTGEASGEWLGRAIRLRKEGRYRDAAAELRKAVAYQPDDAELRYALASVLRQAGDTEAAIAAYRDALARKQKDDWSYELALLLREAGQADAALAELEKLALRRPGDPKLLDAVARVREEGGDLAGAIEMFERAVSAKGKRRRAAQAVKGKDADAGIAKAASQEGKKSRDQVARERARQGNLLASQGKWSQAAARLTKAARDRPKDAQLQLQLGTALAKAGRLDAADRALARSARLQPSSAQAWRNLAAVREQRRDAKGAARAYEGLIQNVAGADPGGRLKERVRRLREEGFAAPGKKASAGKPPTKRDESPSTR